jgi:predicted nucleic acid-binding protein
VILADTSIWVDHLRSRNPVLSSLLDRTQILTHPFIIGEIALGHLRQRKAILELLQNLPHAQKADDGEVLLAIDNHSLAGEGLGYVDVHLLAAVQLTAGATLWTRDKRLLGVSGRMGVAANL